MIKVSECEHEKPDASSFRANLGAEESVVLPLNPEPYYSFGSENGGEDSAFAVGMQEQTLLSGHGC